jgi:hypothetical protein
VTAAISSSGISRLLRAAGFKVVASGSSRAWWGLKVMGRRGSGSVTVLASTDHPDDTTALLAQVAEHLRGRGYVTTYSALQTQRVQALGVTREAGR